MAMATRPWWQPALRANLAERADASGSRRCARSRQFYQQEKLGDGGLVVVIWPGNRGTRWRAGVGERGRRPVAWVLKGEDETSR